MIYLPNPRSAYDGPIYGFFDDPYTLAAKGYNGADRMSVKQFVTMGVLFLLIVIVSLLLRKTKREKLYLIYRIMAIAMPLLEISKITFSSYFDIINNQGFNWGGILPLYTCSMLLFFLPFLAWGKGKMKTWSMAFFSTIGLVAGLSNFVYLSAAGYYPIFTFGGLYSVIFHGTLVFVGMSLMITGEYKPGYRSILEGMIPVLIFSIPVIPFNYILRAYFPNGGYADYMLLMDCNGFPYIGDFANWLASFHLRFLFTLFMLVVVYPLATGLIVFVEVGLFKAFSLVPKKEKAAQ